MKPILFLIALALAGVAAAPLVAERRWRKSSKDMVRGMRRARASQGEPIGESDWAGLPPPVATYFRRALPVDNLPSTQCKSSNWGRCSSTIVGATSALLNSFPPDLASFVWDARIRMAPLVYTLVRDAYLDGTASMGASLAGLFRVADERGGRL